MLEENLWKSTFSFHNVVLRIGTQIVSLASKYFNPVSHLVGPKVVFIPVPSFHFHSNDNNKLESEESFPSSLFGPVFEAVIGVSPHERKLER